MLLRKYVLTCFIDAAIDDEVIARFVSLVTVASLVTSLVDVSLI